MSNTNKTPARLVPPEQRVGSAAAKTGAAAQPNLKPIGSYFGAVLERARKGVE